ncbi:hypothetical protein DMA11_00045 [Marinilabiliaceae bacterium JC017]|nr:hypothetical protein DMA11_00045 [Marinilabiliaceae bacterium JC017]
MKIFKLLFILFLLSPLNVNAQYYASGSDPASIKWYRIKSPHFKVIFPEEFEKEARRLTATLEEVYEYGGYTLGHDPKPINVIIHSRSAYSNGFVTWAPKRIELYPSPNQNIFAQDYLNQLAIHEFRHVVQIDKMNQGFTRFLSFFAGQQAIGGVLGLYIPLWFLEGDATLTETTLSAAGRGRLPSFEQELRAQLLEKKAYSYDKASLGSYRDFVPNHYRMGYAMVAGARETYGKDIWKKALDQTGRKSWSLVPFNQGIKNVTGLNKTGLYQEVFNHWKEQWQAQDDALTLTPIKPITPRYPSYKNYRYPQPLNDSLIIAELTGPGEIQRFVSINTHNGEEKTIFIPGVRDREPFSLVGHQLVWSEQKPHARWENLTYSVIWSYDMKTGKTQQLTRKSRYYAPALSPNGKNIAVVQVTNANQYSIELLNAENGEGIQSISIPDNHFPLTPTWSPDGQSLITILLDSRGKRLSRLNLESQTWKDITEPTFSNIRYPRVLKDTIYFSGSWTGIENIYKVPLAGGNITQVTTSRFGSTSPSFSHNGKSILYSDYTSDGYQLVSTNTNQEVTDVKKEVLSPGILTVNKLKTEEKGLPDFSNLNTTQYEAKKYSRWNLFNFHSWAPIYMNFEDENLAPGASLLSQNLLGNAFTTIGYNADKQYTKEKFYFNFSYKGWMPVFDLDIKYGNDDTEIVTTSPLDTFQITSLEKQQYLLGQLSVKLPFNLTNGKYFRWVEPKISYTYESGSDHGALLRYITQKEDGWYYTGQEEQITRKGYALNTIDYGFFSYNLRKTSQRDITTRMGQVIELKYRHTPFGDFDFGSLMGAHTRLYFPGFLKHHALRFDNDWHKKIRGEHYFTSGDYNYDRGISDYIKFPRGYSAQYNDQLYSFKGDYILPLLNPDLSLTSALYVKRIKMNLFYDYTQSWYELENAITKQTETFDKSYQSLGAEAHALVHVFRFVFPFQVGYRYAYLPNEKQHWHEFLFSMSFSGFSVNEKQW